MRTAAPLLAAVLFLSGCDPEVPTVSSSQALPVSSFPIHIDPSCGGRLYDGCGSQRAIFQAALAEARRTGKTVIVSYGAEWCVWCHVFDTHIRGEAGRFDYPGVPTWASVERSRRDVLRDARALNQFASENLIEARIEGDRAPDGRAVLQTTGAAAHFRGGYPFIFSVTAEGRFAAALDLSRAEIGEQQKGSPFYEGYNRAGLLAELQRIRDEARGTRATTP